MHYVNAMALVGSLIMVIFLCCHLTPLCYKGGYVAWQINEFNSSPVYVMLMIGNQKLFAYGHEIDM